MQHRCTPRPVPLALSALAIAFSAGQPALTHAADTAASGKALENVIVVGEKTDRSLKNTTSSVSVISEETLNSLQNYTINNTVAEVPNVVVTTGTAPNIRGVTGNGAAGGFNSITGGAKARVTTLIDGVAEPFVADLSGDSGIWDIEQIEVYRGPQSTSNGRNSIGGAVYIKTKDPSFDWEGAARLGYRDQDRYVDGAFMISGPIAEDTLAFRLSAQQLDAQTITDDSGYASNPPDYDLNQIDTRRLKGKLLWTPTEDLRALLTYSSNNEQGDTGRVFYSAANPSAYERIWFRDIETDSETTSLKLDYRISDGVAIETLIAYMDYSWGFHAYEATPAAEQDMLFNESNLSVDTKLRLGQAGDTLSGFLGFAYFEREQDYNSTGSAAYGGDDESSSEAFYGELTYAMTERLRLIGGVRVEKEQQDRYFNYATVSREGNLNTDKTLTLPKLALQYDLSDDTTLGLSARQGYNAPGGAFHYASGTYYYFDEEKVNTYEASVRSSLFDGRANFSANLFYNDYEGYQALSSSRVIVNVDEVNTYGLELELQALLTDRLQLNAGLGLLETDIADAGEGYPSATGNELSTAPNVTGNLGLYYHLSDALGAGLSARYVGEYFGDIDNTDERLAGDYTVARLNVDYRGDSWVINAYVNNLFDEEAVTVREPPGRGAPDGYFAIVDPRTVGVSVTWNFL